MSTPLSPDRLDEDALFEDVLYLGILTAWRVKPLSRLEVPAATAVLERYAEWGLTVAPVIRFARNGARCQQIVFSMEPDLVEAYRAEFDHTRLEGETPAVVRSEARYFGYPPCCAEAFIQTPYAPNDLPVEQQALLFHHACPGCQVTPRLIPFYQAALAEARQTRAGFGL